MTSRSDSAAGTKLPVTIQILGHTYQVFPSGDPEDLMEAANAVDELMSRLAKMRNLDTQRAAVFAALHFAQKVQEQQRALDGERNNVTSRSRKIHSLLDLIIED